MAAIEGFRQRNIASTKPLPERGSPPASMLPNTPASYWPETGRTTGDVGVTQRRPCGTLLIR